MNAASRVITPDPVGAALLELTAAGPGAVVVDVGGGSGTRAVPLARAGCSVLVVDSSIDALAILHRRAVDAGVAEHIVGVQADAMSMSTAVPSGAADLVLCHHLLETVDDPAAVVAGLVTALKPGGMASVLAAGRYAAVLAQAAAGRYAAAAAILHDPDGRSGPGDPLRRRFDIAGLEALLTAGGLVVQSTVGVGVAGALSAGGNRRSAENPAALEAALSGHRQLREIAADLHVVARLPVG